MCTFQTRVVLSIHREQHPPHDCRRIATGNEWTTIKLRATAVRTGLLRQVNMCNPWNILRLLSDLKLIDNSRHSGIGFSYSGSLAVLDEWSLVLRHECSPARSRSTNFS